MDQEDFANKTQNSLNGRVKSGLTWRTTSTYMRQWIFCFCPFEAPSVGFMGRENQETTGK